MTLVDLVHTCFKKWLANEAEGFANFKEDKYSVPNNQWASNKSKSDYCWTTLNAVLKTEANVQMRFGMALDKCLRENSQNLDKEYFVGCEMPLRFLSLIGNPDEPHKSPTVDLCIYEKPPALWLSREIPSQRCSSEAEDYLRAIIEVKLISWSAPLSKWKNKREYDRGIGKDLRVFEAAHRKWKDMPLFYLILDESYLNPFWQPSIGMSSKCKALDNYFKVLRANCAAKNVHILSNRP